MLLQAVLALSFAAVVLGEGCCTPPQWEGTEYVLGGFSKGLRRGAIRNKFDISYDANKQAIAVSGKFKRRGVEKEFKVIYDFQASKGYFMLPKDEKCMSYPVKAKFRKACIPDSATKLGETYYGVGDNKLEVAAYAMRFVNRTRRAAIGAIAMVTKKGCIPVSEDVAGKYKRVEFFENVNFAGITGGIKDPTVFQPPEYCQDEGLEMLEEDFYENFSMLQFTHPGVAKDPNEDKEDDEDALSKFKPSKLIL